MYGMIVRRLLLAVITVAVVLTLVFVIVRVIGNPVAAILPVDATEETVRKVRHQLGLDRPIIVQYADYVQNVLTGDLGRSIVAGAPVSERLARAFTNTLQLALAGIAVSILLGVPLGVLAAVHHNTNIDRAANILAAIGMATPTFWFGILLIYVFGVHLGMLPVAGKGTPLHYVLPAFTIGLTPVAGIMRLMRTELLEVLGSDYVRTARAKGLARRQVLWGHAVRNALTPVVTYIGMTFGHLLAGTIAVEIVFAWPGLGMLTIEAISSADFPLIQGVVLMGAAFIVLANLVVDIVYVYIDPRVRTSRG